MIFDIVVSADAWRVAAAVFSAMTSVALVASLWVHGKTLWHTHRRWHWVLVAVTVQQMVNVYLTTARAVDTPAGFPEARVDLPLAALVISALALAVAAGAVAINHPPKEQLR